MQLLVNNTVSGDHWVVDLVKSEVRIGRPGRDADSLPDIPLQSLLVSRSHAVLRNGQGHWTLEHMGINDTLVAGEPLAVNQPVEIQVGDEVRIGEFVLLLVDKGEDAAPQVTNVGISRLMELEHEIHSVLLDRLDLRRGEDISDLESKETRDKVESHLDEILARAIPALSDGDLAKIMHVAVYRRFSISITGAGGGGNYSVPHARDSAAYESNLRDIQKRMAAELGITLDPKDMEADAVKLDEGFTAVFENYALEFSRGSREYLVRSLVRQDILDLIFGLGPLQDLMNMDNISEIMVVCRDRIFVEKSGIVEDSRRAFFNDDMLMAVIERIVAPVGRRIDRSSPLVDARLPDGSRVNVVIPPLAVKGPCVTIRKFSKVPLEIEDLIGFDALTPTMSRFLRGCCVARKNMVISGGTGTGKTTMLNCLSRFIPYRERIVTIEDTAELQLKQAHVVTMESRPPNMEGKGAVTIRDLVKNALRMRPDRVVVGECRGAETIDMLQAMNTGHDGSMTTAHANSAHDLVLRLETMVLSGSDMPISAIREQISSAINLVVQLTRYSDGARRVTQISEVIDVDRDTGEVIIEDIYLYQPGRRGKPGRFIHTGYVPAFIDELLEVDGGTLELFAH